MWWGTWVTHVGRWQERAASQANVLLVRYEDLASELAAEAQRVAAFLDMQPLTPPELSAVVEKCRLAYMRRHAEEFEMHPPHLLQSSNAFFRHGGQQRTQDVPPRIMHDLRAWCRQEGAARGLTIERLYPDLAMEKSEQLVAS
jgi:hypothetical protein